MAEPANFEDFKSEFTILSFALLANLPGKRNVATLLVTLRSSSDRPPAYFGPPQPVSGFVTMVRERVAAFGTPLQALANGNCRRREYDEQAARTNYG